MSEPIDYDDLTLVLLQRDEPVANQAGHAIQTLREQVAAKDADVAAIRELMNCYNLGGWTDALAPMKRALAAEADNAALRNKLRLLGEAYAAIDDLAQVGNLQQRLHIALENERNALLICTELGNRAEASEAKNAALREQVEAFRREQIARSKIDPVTRLHNLCDHLAEQRRESPFTAESLELADASYKELCADNAALRQDAERYRWLRVDNRIGGLPKTPEECDVAIDAAMREGKEKP